MKRIMLVCAAGMSTSLLVTKMEKAAADQGLESDIFRSRCKIRRCQQTSRCFAIRSSSSFYERSI